MRGDLSTIDQRLRGFRLADCYKAYFAASDDGKNFTPPQCVSSTLSYPDAKENIAVRYPPNGQGVVEQWPRGGDCIGLVASADGGFHITWIDGRDGLFEAYTSSIQIKPLKAP